MNDADDIFKLAQEALSEALDQARQISNPKDRAEVSLAVVDRAAKLVEALWWTQRSGNPMFPDLEYRDGVLGSRGRPRVVDIESAEE